MAASTSKSVLFVCLGNICRSPMAEQLFKEMITERGELDAWTIDSAATSTYQIGNEPDSRTNKTLQERGKQRNKHRARQITDDDYNKFQYIFGFDESNISNIKRRQPAGSKAIVKLLGEYDPEGERIIEDPYYGGSNDLTDFQHVYDQCTRCLTAFLEKEFK